MKFRVISTIDVRSWHNKTKRGMDKWGRKIALEVYYQCMNQSPMNTGRFINSWRFAVNRIDSTVAGARKSTAAARARQLGATVKGMDRLMAKAKVTAKAFKITTGDVAFISNSLSYAAKLEYGFSRQAPQGVMRPAIMKTLAAAQFKRFPSERIL